MRSFQIDDNAADQRLDRYLKKLLPRASKGEIQRWIRTKKVKINDKRVKSSARIKWGDCVKIYLPDGVIDAYQAAFQPLAAADVNLDIVYQDDDLLIVNKPSGLLTHPAEGEYRAALSTQVISYLKHRVAATFKPASINRLDKNTSGLVIFCKNYPALKHYNALMRQRQITKKYLAIVEGRLLGNREVSGYLTKNQTTNKVSFHRQKIAGAKRIASSIRPIEATDDYSLVEIDIKTGRSHQIRLSLAEIGHPIAGDVKYGGKPLQNIRHQLLHAYKLEFAGRTIECASAVLTNLWQRLRDEANHV